jgi:hypothetical protein
VRKLGRVPTRISGEIYYRRRKLKGIHKRTWRAFCKWFSASSHEKQAALVGLAALAITIVLSIVLWKLWQWFLVPDDATPNDRSGMLLSFLQMFTALVATFIAGALGFYVIREFTEQHQSPDIVIDFPMFYSRETSENLVNPSGEPSSYSFSFSVENKSSVIATWFVIKLNLPFMMAAWMGVYGQADRSQNNIFALMVNHMTDYLGDLDENWKGQFRIGNDQIVPGASLESPFSLSFYSHGKVALYPNDEVVLCSFKIPAAVLKIDYHYHCSYSIASDKGPQKTGHQTIRFTTKENFAKAESPLLQRIPPEDRVV